MFQTNYLQNKGDSHMAQNEAPIILDETEQKIIDIIDAHRDQIIDFVDDELAYVVTAKIFALSAYRLLKNGAEKAKEVVKNYHPIFTKETYIQYMDSFISESTDL